MSSKNFLWHNNAKKFDENDHAIFGASKSAWLNYSVERMIEVYSSDKASKVGTELHALAAELIRKKIMLPKDPVTLNMYVNDCIFYDLRPEERLYYSEEFYGTADAIGVTDGVLRVFDLKTGKHKASPRQLLIYVVFFLLEYGMFPSDFDEIEIRIYQNDSVEIDKLDAEDILPVMDKIQTVDRLLRKIKDESVY